MCYVNGCIGGVRWCFIFPFLLWNIWLARNRFVFERKEFHAYRTLAREYYFGLQDDKKASKVYQERQVPWSFLSTGYCKLNTDGASAGGVSTGIGKVIDDEKFLTCFSKYIYIIGNNKIEIWVVRDGLKVVVDLRIQKLEVESDPTFTIQFCGGNVRPPWGMPLLVEYIISFKDKFSVVVFKHEYKESNGATGCLTKLSSKKELEG
ncbi:uncharacterized protein LOC113359932 [Papaver somniferum]|uniref:uncharacterized protein LOC113359932 n=1 Tax=Papaver somniferum TaxID=3469 RepID=UPI000E6FEEA3|nr:uncharacterized protein LOC113359932 [Papaver somniferum]